MICYVAAVELLNSVTSSIVDSLTAFDPVFGLVLSVFKHRDERADEVERPWINRCSRRTQNIARQVQVRLD